MNPIEAHAYLKQLGNEVLDMRLSVDAPARVLRELDDPQKSFPSVLIGGTNGKGSVSEFVAAALSRAGYRTGLYTSPHLETVRERIRLDGRRITPEEFARSLTSVTEAQDRLRRSSVLPRKLTYFETLTLAAFSYFRDQAVQVAVLEVGLGGRLDATNLSDPLVSCIASIGFDHRDVLGTTLAEIAREKGAIARPGHILWLGPLPGEAEQAVRARAPESRIYSLSPSDFRADSDGTGRYRVQTRVRGAPLEFQLSVFGRHQAANAVLAARLVESLLPFGFDVPPHALQAALQETQIPGRLEKLLDQPTFFLDGGHNPPAIEAVCCFIREQYSEKVHLIFGMMRDKEIESCAALLAPLCATVFLSPVNNRRSATAEELARFFPHNRSVPAADSEEATALALAAARTGQSVFACGSLFLAGEIKTLLNR